MTDNQIGYEFAGKGHRSRMRLEDVPKKMRPKDARKRYERKPEMERTRAREIEDATSAYSASSLKTKLRLMTLDDVGYLDQMEMLKREGIRVSGVTVGNLRAEMREIIKLLDQQGLLNTEALERRRKQHHRRGSKA